MASDTDSGHLTVLQLSGIGSLIVFLAVASQVVGVAFLIVIIVCETRVHADLECLEVHGIGVKDILVLDFRIIPRFGHMNLIGIGFSILTATALAQDIGTAVAEHGYGSILRDSRSSAVQPLVRCWLASS